MHKRISATWYDPNSFIYPTCSATTPLVSCPDNNAIVCGEFVRRTRGCARFLSLSSPPRLGDLQGPGWNENEMKQEKKKKKRKWKVMKSRLGSGPLISPQQKLFAWLIMNHCPNALWCKIHNVNIMLRSTSRRSEALLRLPVSMYFAFIHQLKMHLVWIWKYYAKLQCSCKQIMVLWDSVVLND